MENEPPFKGFSFLAEAIDFEMMFEKDIPVSVSINEAIDLAKKYGGADDAPFVNGVLGSVAKSLSEKNE